MEEIENKVANSGLITLSLEDFYLPGKRLQLDIAPWLYEGIMLREKDFRDFLKNNDWQQYQNAFVAVHCSEDAIIPQWAYMLLGSHLQGVAQKVVYGDLNLLESVLMEKSLSQMDLAPYQDQRLIIKGCGDLNMPPQAYLKISMILKPIVKSLMFGEACSMVPIFKRKREGK